MASSLLSNAKAVSRRPQGPRLVMFLTAAILLAGCASSGGVSHERPSAAAESGGVAPGVVQAPTGPRSSASAASVTNEAQVTTRTPSSAPEVRRAPKPENGEIKSAKTKAPALPPDSAPASDSVRARAPTQASAVSCKVKPDGVEWVYVSGECRNGYVHGVGVARSRDGKRHYEGDFVDGAFEGRGTYDWGDGTRYVGEFRASRKNGNGEITYASGNRYAGEFRDNTYQGSGKYQDIAGETYAGEFAGGKYNGQGTYTWPNGDVYTGEFKNGKMHGRGVYTKGNGDRYEGDFENDQMRGIGTYHHANGDVYTGEFKDGKMSGQGIYRYADGTVYTGEFARNKKHGRGKLTSDAGDVEQRWIYGVKVSGESR